MTARRRVVALVCSLLAGVSVAGAQGTSPSPRPDTAAARAIVDSLVRTGAWRLPKTDTVRLAADTVRVSSPVNDGLRVASFTAGIVILIGLGIATVLFARRFFAALDGRSTIGMRSRWGGFGGGDGGWDISPALSLLALTVVLAVLTAVVATAAIGGGGDKAARNESGRPADATAAAPAKK